MFPLFSFHRQKKIVLLLQHALTAATVLYTQNKQLQPLPLRSYASRTALQLAFLLTIYTSPTLIFTDMSLGILSNTNS
jgi:hypothetical protein